MVRKPKSVHLTLQKLVSDIVHAPSTTDTGARLSAMGLPSEPKLVDALHEVSRRYGPTSPAALAAVIKDLLQSPYPTGAMINFVRFLDIAGTSNAFLSTAAGGKPIREILATIFGSSQYMADIIIRNPGFLYWLIEKRTWDRRDTTGTYAADLEADTAKFQSLDARLDAARRFQRRMLLKIGVFDLLGLQTIEETTASLSCLADAVVRCVLGAVWRDMATAQDTASPAGLSLLALGKLGGCELNYSSDIDLLYVCEDTDDRTFDFYHKVARRVSTALSEATSEGYFYRVDLRLRPDGETGPLVNSLTAMRIYYENRGRPWEFQAMLKARVIAGDTKTGEEFLGTVAGLAFNPALSYSPVETIGVMRKRILENISVEDRSFNIKLMEGGIRDIEFIVQTLQLLYGNKYPDLRVTNTLRGINLARKRKLITKSEEQTLAKAYRFFRLVEHRLQMMHQIRTHTIPRSDPEIQLLARRVATGPLGNFTPRSFLSMLTKHLNEVRVLSDTFFTGDTLPEAALVLLSPEDETARETLAALNFEDTAQALRIVQSLAYGSFPQLVDRNTRGAFQRFLPALLEELSRTADPNSTLVNFSRLATASNNVSSLYDFLNASETSRSLVRDLAGTSSILTGKLCAQMAILDSVLEDPAAVLETSVADEAPLAALVQNPRGSDRARRGKAVSSALDRRTVAAWFNDMQSGTFPEKISETLTRSARQLVSAGFDALDGADGAAVFAMGSYAIGEPRLGSDVDLLVVARKEALEPVTRATQVLNRALSEGSILKLDYRLRGEGANAPLVQDLGFYKSYFENRMSPWESVAFTKCARWSGDETVAGEFVATLLPYLTARPGDVQLEALVETRRRLEGLVAADAALLETKRSAGGRYDIEYLCAIGLAIRGEPFPLDSGTSERLRLLAGEDLISQQALADLQAALIFYTRVDYLMELQGFSLPAGETKRNDLVRYLEKTFELLGLDVEHPFDVWMTDHKAAVRGCYNEFLSGRL